MAECVGAYVWKRGPPSCCETGFPDLGLWQWCYRRQWSLCRALHPFSLEAHPPLGKPWTRLTEKHIREWLLMWRYLKVLYFTKGEKCPRPLQEAGDVPETPCLGCENAARPFYTTIKFGYLIVRLQCCKDILDTFPGSVTRRCPSQ